MLALTGRASCTCYRNFSSIESYVLHKFLKFTLTGFAQGNFNPRLQGFLVFFPAITVERHHGSPVGDLVGIDTLPVVATGTFLESITPWHRNRPCNAVRRKPCQSPRHTFPG